MAFGRLGSLGIGFSRPGCGATGLHGDAYVNFATMSNGAPTTSATGQTILRASAATSIVQATVSNGVLVAADSGANPTAAYTGFALREDIKSMYADISLGDANDNVTLIATYDVTNAAVVASSIHIVFTPTQFIIGYWSSSVLTTPQTGSYTFPFNTKRRVGWRLNGNDIYILQPDGVEVGPFTTSAAATRTNHVMIFEHYRGATGTPGSKIYAVAANLFATPLAAGRTNIITQQNNVSDAAWSKIQLGTITAGQSDAEGGVLADKVLEDATTNVHLIGQLAIAKAASAVRYTQRCKVKPNGRDWFNLLTANGPFSANANTFYNITTGALGFSNGAFVPTISIYPLANGFYQVQQDFVSDTDTQIQPLFQIASADNTANYAGDVTKGVIVYDEWLFSRPT